MKKIFLIIALFFLIPFIYAGNYGAGTYGSGLYGIGEVTVVPPSPSGGGPSGGGAAVTIPNFEIDKNLIKILIKQGETQRETIEIKNNMATSINISLDADENLKEFMLISEESFSLSQKESKNVFIDFFTKEDEIPQVIIGRIIVKNEKTGEKETINVIIEIKERKPLFDMIVDVLTKEVTPQSNVKAEIRILNLGDLNNMDISIYSAIKDFDGNVLSFKKEDIAINKELEITRKLRVPRGTAYGTYIFYSEAYYGNINASSTDTFEVVEKKAIKPYFFMILGGILILSITIVIILIYRRRNKYKKHKKKRHRKKK